MSSTNARTWGLDRSPILVGALAGLIAGVPMGIAVHLGTSLMPVLGGIVGVQSAAVGWLVHLVTATFAGALFGWMVEWPLFRTLTDTVGECILLGVVHATLLAFIMIGFVLPAMVELLAVSGEGVPVFQVPGPSGGSLVPAIVFAAAHLVYGVVLGGSYAVLEDVRAEPEPRGPDPEGHDSG